MDNYQLWSMIRMKIIQNMFPKWMRKLIYLQKVSIKRILLQKL